MTSQFGQSLLSFGHFASEEVKTHLQSLSSEKASLLAMWEDGREQFGQCLELQLFMRDTEQVDGWMGKQEVRKGKKGGREREREREGGGEKRKKIWERKI